MTKIKMRLTLIALGLFCLTGVSQAQEPKNLLSADRLSFAVGGNYGWHDGEVSNLPAFRKEVEVGVYGAYSLTSYQNADGQWKPRLILTASSLYGLDNRTFHTSVGVRLPIFVGKD